MMPSCAVGALGACITGSGRNTTDSMRPHPLRLLPLTGTLATAALLATTACAKLTAPVREESTASAPAAAAEPTAKAAAEQPAPTPDNEAKIAASHILIGFKGAMRARTERSKEDAQKLAAQLAARARKGEDFAELARNNSEGPSASRGGALNEFTRQQMVKPFADAAFALKVGEVSNPVETPFGFHIIKRTK